MADYALVILSVLGFLTLLWLARLGREAKPGKPPPAHVARIFEGRVVIEREEERIRALLEASPFSSNVVVGPQGYLAIEFIDKGPHLENVQLHELLSWLRDQGLAFSVEKGWGPAEFMEDLRVHGRIRGRFKTIYWTSPGDWHVSESYPENEPGT